LYGTVGEHKYIAGVEEKLITPNEDGTFSKYESNRNFNDLIPEDFESVNVESVFYCLSPEDANIKRKLLVLDQTYKNTTLIIPGLETPDYSTASVLGFTYNVNFVTETNSKVHNIKCNFEFNSDILANDVDISLKDINGPYEYYAVVEGGFSDTLTASFTNCNMNMQFARLEVSIRNKVLFSEIIIVHSIVNEYNRTNMSTLP
jgi:hypothetical protein